MRKLFLSLLLCCLAAVGGFAQDVTVTDITVETEGQLGYKVLEVYNAFDEVKGLRISGPINEEDWKTLKEMPYLEELYMDDAIVLNEAVPEWQFSNQYHLRIVTLPYSCKTVEKYAFYWCSRLESATMPNVTSIENEAFDHCASLQSVTIPNVTSIATQTFNSCKNLQSVTMPNVTSIGSGAFVFCEQLRSVTMPNVISIEGSAFESCSGLQSITLPNITSIGDCAFWYCASLTSVNLSDKLTTLGRDCFKECNNLTTLILPASIIEIQDGVFDNCNRIREIECNAPVPPAVGTFPFANEVIYAATLRVQSASMQSYRDDPFWGRFAHWEESPTRITDLILNNNYTLNEDVRLDKLNLTVMPGVAFTIHGNTLQEFKSVTLVANDGGCGVFMSNSNAVVSDATQINYEMEPSRWYYVTLPFDVDITAMEVTDNALLAIYDYDGETRAANGTGGSWRRVTEGTLRAGQGYIIQASKQTVLTMKAGYGNLNAAFTPYAVSTPLNEWPSALGAPEAGWNFVGNPYPTYFDIRHMDFSAPITVWNGSTYAAYSVADDELALKPLQPFFVQCPAGTERITFNTAGRQTTATIDHSRTAAPRNNGAAQRRLVNLTLASADGTEHDRTRVVVNAGATDGYEMDCDAAKMMSTDAAVAQIWTQRDGTRYAINEGPQAGGRVAVDLYLPAAGEYTIAATRADIGATLYDSLTGAETLLADGGAYTFAVAKGGNVSGRFFLVLATGTTDICTTVKADDTAGTTVYYTADGRRAGTDADMLPAGVYVKKDNKGNAVKVIVR